MFGSRTALFFGRTLLASVAFAVVVGAPATVVNAQDATTASRPGLPRGTDGKPDLTGIWEALSTAEWGVEPHAARKDAPAGLGIVEGDVIPYQPWALARRDQNFAKRAKLDPLAKCFMPGVPRITYTPLPFQIFQSEKELTFLYQYAHSVRTVHANGAPHPPGHIDWWLGDSRGHWEGDTLVVDVTHFNDQTWFDRAGNFHSDALHVIERYTLIGPDHIEYRATIEDPKVFTRPWNINLVLYRHKEKNFQLLEHECYTFDYERFYP
ncbi:MAG: hypothetical protein WDO68_07040 [Gammaproteobacteria bacterium]